MSYDTSPDLMHSFDAFGDSHPQNLLPRYRIGVAAIDLMLVELQGHQERYKAKL